MPLESVAVDPHEAQTIFRAIDHYLDSQEAGNVPQLESTDLGTEFANFTAPLRNHYARLHAEQVAHIVALREACATAHQEVQQFAEHDAAFGHAMREAAWMPR